MATIRQIAMCLDRLCVDATEDSFCYLLASFKRHRGARYNVDFEKPLKAVTFCTLMSVKRKVFIKEKKQHEQCSDLSFEQAVRLWRRSRLQQLRHSRQKGQNLDRSQGGRTRRQHWHHSTKRECKTVPEILLRNPLASMLMKKTGRNL